LLSNHSPGRIQTSASESAKSPTPASSSTPVTILDSLHGFVSSFASQTMKVLHILLQRDSKDEGLKDAEMLASEKNEQRPHPLFFTGPKHTYHIALQLSD
jgi:hypothetical protein